MSTDEVWRFTFHMRESVIKHIHLDCSSGGCLVRTVASLLANMDMSGPRVELDTESTLMSDLALVQVKDNYDKDKDKDKKVPTSVLDSLIPLTILLATILALYLYPPD